MARVKSMPARFKGCTGRKNEHAVVDAILVQFNQMTEGMAKNHRIAAAKQLATLFNQVE